VLIQPGSAASSPRGDTSIPRDSQLHAAEDIATTIKSRQTNIVHEPPTYSVVRKDGDEHESRKVIAGSSDILDNNDVNFLAAAITSLLAMYVASFV
jgi:hypothetical protein